MDYFQNLQKAFKITWENKGLWVLGFLSLLGNSSSSASFNSDYSSGEGIDANRFGYVFNEISNWWSSIGFAGQAGLVLGFIIISLGFYIIFLYLSSRAEAGMLTAVNTIDNGGVSSLGIAWKEASSRTFGLIKQRVLIGLPGYVFGVTVLIAVIILISQSRTLNLQSVFPIFIVSICGCGLMLFLYSLIMSIIYAFSSRISVLNGRGVIDSFKDSFSFLTRNIGPIFISWLVSLIVSIPVGIVFAGIAFLVALPLAVMMTALAMTNIMAMVLVGIGFALIAGIFINLFNSVYALFNSAYWTLVFKQLK